MSEETKHSDSDWREVLKTEGEIQALLDEFAGELAQSGDLSPFSHTEEEFQALLDEFAGELAQSSDQLLIFGGSAK